MLPQGITFRLGTIGLVEYWLAYDMSTERLIGARVRITSFSSQQVLRAAGSGSRGSADVPPRSFATASSGGSSSGNPAHDPGSGPPPGNVLLNYFYFAFEKFPASNSLGLESALQQVR